MMSRPKRVGSERGSYMGATKTKFQLAQGVTYTDGKGRLKAAIITALPETIHPDGSLKLGENQVMLTVFSPGNGASYGRLATLDEEDHTFHRAEPDIDTETPSW